MKHLLFIVLTITLFVSCKSDVKPQTPANVPEIDTVAQNLLYTNQLLVEQTNKELALFVKQTGIKFAMHDYGFWYRWLERNDALQIKADDELEVHYQVWLMDSTKCMDIVNHVRVGKKEIPTALDKALLLMRYGETMEIIAPWYCAYGQKGEDLVPAYTNVRFCLHANQ